MDFTDSDKAKLHQDGYVRFPGVIPDDVIGAARRAINSSIGSRGLPPDELQTYRARSFCPEITSTAPIKDLLYASPMWSLAEQAIGEGKLSPVTSGQIALRFPQEGPARDPHPHIDGMYTPDNGVPRGTIANFTALVGVLLSDVPEPYSGNFTAWPGTHRQYEDHFRAHGPDALLHGMPEVELPEPVQITGKAGDAMLCHYQLGHGIAGNASPNIRYAVFFRLFRQGHEMVHWECMTDIWREWDGMRSIVSKNLA